MSTPLRRRGALHHWELHFGPNMTPMVDVVMVILIFFMAGASVVGPDWFLRAGAAGAAAGPAADPFALPPARFEVQVRLKGGAVVASGLGASEVDAAGLGAAARALVERAGAENVEVVVRAGDDVPYQDVVDVIDACAGAGVRRVGIGSGP